MRKIGLILGFAIFPALANAQTLPDWVTPTTSEGVPQEWLDAVRDGDQAGRDIAYPAMPDTIPDPVRNGVNGNGTCMGCHTTTGMGAPQSAPLAGLPPGYFMRQIVNFRTGARGQAYRANMADFASNMTIEQAMALADYYASLDVEPRIEVVETEMAPKVFYGPRDIPAAYPDGSMEPIGDRIVEIAKTPEAPYMNGAVAFTAYVPEGSIARGAELANRGLGKTIACGLCHGDDLNGNGDVPGIAGRSALHTARQLMEYRGGMRGGESAHPMLEVAEHLSDAEIVAISAYVASLPPR